MKKGTLEERVFFLEAKAKQVRLNILRMIFKAQSGHPGGSLSATDIVTALYFDMMNVDPQNPKMEDRDKFILSKGHACPVWYAALCLKGYFPEAELDTLRKFETKLQGHPVLGKVPGIEATTGSLGVGFSTALGIALESKLSKRDNTVYSLLGDGELAEGIVWEAASSAGFRKLDNFVAIIDRNHLQNDGFTDDILCMESISAKFEAFNWHVIECDGHKMEELIPALEAARDYKGKPVCIIAHTVKGKGVSFMENVRGWHGKAPNEEQYAQAQKEIAGE